MKCADCGADVPLGAGKCDYCGSAIEPPVSAPPLQAARSLPEILERVKASAAYEKCGSTDRLAALPDCSPVSRVGPFVVLAVCLGFAVLMLFTQQGSGGLVVSRLGFLFCVAAGALLFFRFRKKFHEFQREPIWARAAVLVGKRTEVRGGSGERRATTQYYVTAEFEDGTRQELSAVTPALYGRVAEGDAGVLFTRASVALDFDRVVI